MSKSRYSSFVQDVGNRRLVSWCSVSVNTSRFQEVATMSRQVLIDTPITDRC